MKTIKKKILVLGVMTSISVIVPTMIMKTNSHTTKKKKLKFNN